MTNLTSALPLRHNLTHRLDGIDLLRALAMTGVVAQHSGVFPAGWTGVWLFYVISGFVIARSFVAHDTLRAKGSPWRAYGKFMHARLVRIMPALCVYLIICSIVAALLSTNGFFEHLPYIAASVFNWHMISLDWSVHKMWGPIAHLWTISVEQQFYVFFPLIALAAPHRWKTQAIVVLILLAPVMRAATGHWLDVTLSPEAKAFAIYASTHNHIDAFLVGALLAYRLNSIKDNEAIAKRTGQIALALVSAYVITYAAVNASMGAHGMDIMRNIYSGITYGQGREVWIYPSITVASAWAVLKATNWQRPSTPLVSRLLWDLGTWVGRISYSGYLYHALTIWVIKEIIFFGTTETPDILKNMVIFGSAMLATVLIAGLSYKYVEQPLYILFKKIPDKAQA